MVTTTKDDIFFSVFSKRYRLLKWFTALRMVMLVTNHLKIPFAWKYISVSPRDKPFHHLPPSSLVIIFVSSTNNFTYFYISYNFR